jgi:hypothetical protein
MKTIIITVAAIFISITLMAQKAEVIYFKADLACCQAKACNALQNDVKVIVENNFKADNVVFKEVKLSDISNKELVEKYNAKSQTVVVVVKKKKSEKTVDITDMVRSYSRLNNKEEFEKQLVAKINETIK